MEPPDEKRDENLEEEEILEDDNELLEDKDIKEMSASLMQHFGSFVQQREATIWKALKKQKKRRQLKKAMTKR